MDSSAIGPGDNWDDLKTNYAQHLASGVDLPGYAAGSFSSAELAVLGVIRDVAYKSPSGACSLTANEIARLAQVPTGTAVSAITIAIAAGLIERDGRNFINRHIQYKVG
jgi:hypothetical protein